LVQDNYKKVGFVDFYCTLLHDVNIQQKMEKI